MKENYLDFISGWEKCIFKRDLNTQEEPKENKGPILEFVFKSCKRKVIAKDKNVLIVFYAP